MVVQSDFKVELVDADTKIPFREHYHNGKTYVEVEPDIEFFISRQRVTTMVKEDFLIKPFVDGKWLGFHSIYIGVPKRNEQPKYDGVWVKSKVNNNPNIYENALRFVKPKLSETPETANAGPILLGKVEYRMYKAHRTRQPDAPPRPETFAGSTAKGYITEGGMKPVLSEQATTSMTASRSKRKYFPGVLLHTITLNYATAPGLIHVGILPKPPCIYSHHQLLSGKKNLRIRPPLVPAKRMSTKREIRVDGTRVATEEIYYDFFDLTSLKSDSDSDSDDELYNRFLDSLPIRSKKKTRGPITRSRCSK